MEFFLVSNMHIKFLSQIKDVEKHSWDSLNHESYPFLSFDFLNALEESGCVSERTGWQPFHVTLWKEESLIGAMPLYLKNNSQGEFVFDYSWANAYYQHKKYYYPKFVSSIPFTPATGPRILFSTSNDKKNTAEQIFKAIQKVSKENEISSWHILFPEEDEKDLFESLGLSTRKNVQFMWKNNNYESFDHFLEFFSSRNRKNLKKERRKIAEQDLEIKRFTGNQISLDVVDDFYSFYVDTHLRRSGHSGYLNKDFFEEITQTIADNILIILAYKNGQAVAGSFFFYDQNNLYGRYWGASNDYDALHFECCYYQGIDFCIEKNIKRFDPGVQGEHKIKRGFEPTFTFSSHWIENHDFSLAISDFLLREDKYIKDYHQDATTLLPFKNI